MYYLRLPTELENIEEFVKFSIKDKYIILPSHVIDEVCRFIYEHQNNAFGITSELIWIKYPNFSSSLIEYKEYKIIHTNKLSIF